MSKRWPKTTRKTLIPELKALWPMFTIAAFAVVAIFFTAWYTSVQK